MKVILMEGNTTSFNINKDLAKIYMIIALKKQTQDKFIQLEKPITCIG